MSTPSTATAYHNHYPPHHRPHQHHHSNYNQTSSHSASRPYHYDSNHYRSNIASNHQSSLPSGRDNYAAAGQAGSYLVNGDGVRASDSSQSASNSSANNAAYYSNVNNSDMSKFTNGTNGAHPDGSTSQRKRKGQVDWEEFYKNGVPQEVIVIDDSPPPPKTYAPVRPKASDLVNGTHSRYIQQQASNKRRRVGVNDQRYGEGSTSSAHSNYHNAYSETRTPGTKTATTTYNESPSQSRHVAAIAPAPTLTTLKRKRVTRQSLAEAQKEREKQVEDAFSMYRPPKKPIIKCNEVPVKKIDDGSGNAGKVDDEDGHYIIHNDTYLTQRYKINKLLGQGTFGKVVEAYDRVEHKLYAIKVIRSVQKYRDASRIELRVLRTLAANDQENRNKCIHLRHCFDFQNHICIVTDLLGMSVFDFLKANSFAPFPNSHIQSFARQLLVSVAFLHDLSLIHTDLKPENILLVHNDYREYSYHKTIPSSSTTNQRTAKARRVLLDTDIRLIDFGSATFQEEYHSSVVSTRHYRAPEIILGLGWSFPCDMWSIGCILVEFYTGDALFQTHDNLEHLAMMEAVCGAKIDPRIIKQITGSSRTSNPNQAAKYFKGQRLDYPNPDTPKTSKRYVKAMKGLNEIIQSTSAFNRQFLDLLKRIFLYDPAKRISARDALKHPWFRESIHDEGTSAAAYKRDRDSRETEEDGVTEGEDDY